MRTSFVVEGKEEEQEAVGEEKDEVKDKKARWEYETESGGVLAGIPFVVEAKEEEEAVKEEKEEWKDRK